MNVVSTKTNLRRLIGAAAIAAMLLTNLPTRAAETSLPTARDLAVEAQAARQSGMPLIVLVSLTGCPHCELVRRSHLLPLQRDGSVMPKPVIRQVEINGREMLRDFSGTQISHAEFVQRYNIKLAPVVFFFDAKGEQLATPLVGTMLPDFYGAYFNTALSEAKSKLRGIKVPVR